MKRVSLYIDLGFCLVFLLLMIFMFPVERWWGTYPVFFSLFVAWLYATYFLYKYYIVPNLFHGRRLRLYALAAMFFSLGITLLFSSYKITSPFYHQWQLKETELAIHSWGVRLNQQAIWLHYILVVTFCCAVGMLTEAYRQRLAREEIEYERNKAELALYKAQINPHFLFSSNEPCYVHIHLTQCDGRLTFETANKVFERVQPDSNRMGIENCRRRLSLLYPDRHRLEVGPGEARTFHVKLELQSDAL